MDGDPFELVFNTSSETTTINFNGTSTVHQYSLNVTMEGEGVEVSTDDNATDTLTISLECGVNIRVS